MCEGCFFNHMKDIDLLEILLQYMYKNGEVLYYERAFRESGIEEDIDIQTIFRLHALLKSTGMIDVLPKLVENHPEAIKLNSEGYAMMLMHGSYTEYLNAKNKPEKLDQKLKRSTIWLNYTNLAIGLLSFIAGVCLSELTKKLWQELLSFFQ